MIRLMSQLAKLPMSAFVRGVELFLNALKDLQGLAEQGIDTVAGMPPALDPSNRSNNLPEVRRMADQDLNGDDLKYVSSSILFTKRDLEATLEREHQEVVNYSTDGGSYGALKIAKFMKKIGLGKVERPAVWRENNYPPDATDERHWEIPDEDLKYLSFIYHVDRHLPRQERNYEKEQVQVLREIRDRL